MYLFLHTVKGTPFETPDQGKARLLTHWEQMDYGVQFTSSRKFLTISPIVLWVSFGFLRGQWSVLPNIFWSSVYVALLCFIDALDKTALLLSSNVTIWTLFLPLVLAVVQRFCKMLTAVLFADIFLPVSTQNTIPRISWSTPAPYSASSSPSYLSFMEFGYLGSTNTDRTDWTLDQEQFLINNIPGVLFKAGKL